MMVIESGRDNNDNGNTGNNGDNGDNVPGIFFICIFVILVDIFVSILVFLY